MGVYDQTNEKFRNHFYNIKHFHEENIINFIKKNNYKRSLNVIVIRKNKTMNDYLIDSELIHDKQVCILYFDSS